MHDPCTLVADLGFVVIWHRDKGGRDGACGWGSPHLTERQLERVKSWAWSEAREPWFLRIKAKKLTNPVLLENLMRAAILSVSKMIEVPVRYDEACLWAVEMIHNPVDNFRGAFCYLPGWHSNSKTDHPSEREYKATHLFINIGRWILRERRRWYQHPRYHAWHWRFDWPPLRRLSRWLFTRCSGCGRRFGSKDVPVAPGWHDDNPGLFRSEKGLYHSECLDNFMTGQTR